MRVCGVCGVCVEGWHANLTVSGKQTALVNLTAESLSVMRRSTLLW